MVYDLRSHRGIIKVYNPESGRSLTFKVEKRPDHVRFAPGRVMVSLLVGSNPDNRRNWRAFAFLHHDRFLVWKSKAGRFYGECAMLLNDPTVGHSRGYTYNVSQM